MKKILNQPLQTACLILATEVVMTLMVIVHPSKTFMMLLISLLLIVTLFGLSYMFYALVDARQRGTLKINLILAVIAPPAYVFLLLVYAASRVADDL